MLWPNPLGTTKQQLCSGFANFQYFLVHHDCIHSRIKVALVVKQRGFFAYTCYKLPLKSEIPGGSNVSTSSILSIIHLDLIPLDCVAWHPHQESHLLVASTAHNPCIRSTTIQAVDLRKSSPKKFTNLKKNNFGGVIPLPIIAFLGGEVHYNTAMDWV